MVGYDCAEAALKAFRQTKGDGSASVKLEQFKGMAHSSCARELRLVAGFLQTHLMPSGSEAPELKIPAWEPGGAAADSECDASDGEDGDSGETPDLIFVSKRALDTIREQLTSASGGGVSKDAIRDLVKLEEVPDDEVLVPVDAAVLGEEALEDVDAALEKLGARAVAEAFVKAAQEAASTGAVELTAVRWRKIVDAGFSDVAEEGEEEERESGEEEADGESDACEDPDGGGEASEEASSKRPRLS